MTEILFAGQLTEEGFREVNALAGRKILLFWTPVSYTHLTLPTIYSV